MYKYFNGCINPGMVKSMFRDLALRYHPDIAGDSSTRVMQDIINEYHNILKSFSGFKFHTKENKEYEYNYRYQAEQDIVDKVNAVLALKLDNIILDVVGSWVWVSGTSKDQANLFNKEGLGFRWSSKHKQWYWNKTMFFKKRASGLSYTDIKRSFGSCTVDNNDAYKQVG